LNLRAVLKALEKAGVYDAPLVTEIAPLRSFHAAEEHHQDYFARHPQAAYCRTVIRPKVEKLEKVFRERLKGRSTR